MTQKKINDFGNELLQKTHDENCEIKTDWVKVNSLKLKSIYLPYFIDTYEIIATRNESMFDDILNRVNLFYHEKMSIYMATFNQQIIYHNAHYMIISKFPGSKNHEWKKIN